MGNPRRSEFNPSFQSICPGQDHRSFSRVGEAAIGGHDAVAVVRRFSIIIAVCRVAFPVAALRLADVSRGGNRHGRDSSRTPATEFFLPLLPQISTHPVTFNLRIPVVQYMNIGAFFSGCFKCLKKRKQRAAISIFKLNRGNALFFGSPLTRLYLISVSLFVNCLQPDYRHSRYIDGLVR